MVYRAGFFEAPRGYGVFARRGILTIQGPDFHRESGFLSRINGARTPWSVIEAYLNTLDWPGPQAAP